MSQIVLASDNQHKLEEIQALMQELCEAPWQIVPQSDFNIRTPEETGNSFAENALLKARFVAQQVSLPVIAEDSGIEVAALDGQPGIYSARYAADSASNSASGSVSDQDNLEKLLHNMQGIADPERAAQFCCTVAYLPAGGTDAPQIFSGHWQGQITQSPQGENGFGYDPIFYVPQHNCTAAQLSSEAKNSLSHRRQAFTQLAEYLNRTQ